MFMKFSCTKENLLEALNTVGGVAGKQVNLPILSNILLKTDEQKIVLIATNLDIAITAQIRGKIDKEGSFTVPARMVSDFINLLSTERVDIEVVGQELVISSGKSTTKIKGMGAEEFPIIPQLENGLSFTVDAEKLKKGLSEVISSVARNDIRPELSGIFWGFNVYDRKGLTMAATDSYRLAETIIPLVQGSDEKRIILPAKTAQEIIRIASVSLEGQEQVKILVGENQINVMYGTTQLVSRLVDGQYPDYVQIIPQSFKTKLQISLARLVKEIKAAGLFTTTGVNAVTLKAVPVEGVLRLFSASTQAGEYTSEIPVEIQGEENSILLSHRYLLDGLQTAGGETVQLNIINGDAPCLLLPEKEEGFRYIIMPIRQ
jgi:DNA polymerase-3 subunit beta